MTEQKQHTILVSVGELWLKGRNRRDFVSRLKDNIAQSFVRCGVKSQSQTPVGARLRYQAVGTQADITLALESVPGIAQFAIVDVLARELDVLHAHVRAKLVQLSQNGAQSVRFDTRRADKSFELTSPQINAQLGAIVKELGMRVDYSHALNTITILVEQTEFFVATDWTAGIGGLPVGTGGRVLMLMSGGIDSPVAAWELMRRGCRVDYLHIHTLRNNDAVQTSKIARIIKQLNIYGLRAKLFVVPYLPFDLAVQGAVPPGMEVVAFKNFMHQLAAQIAQNYKYDAIANGDNLAQVASQTIHNMRAGQSGVNDTLLLRPLVTALKQDIITRAETIGTYSDSIAPYKDCCSLTAKNPKTRVNYEKFTKAIENFPMESVIADSLEQISIYEIKT